MTSPIEPIGVAAARLHPPENGHGGRGDAASVEAG